MSIVHQVVVQRRWLTRVRMSLVLLSVSGCSVAFVRPTPQLAPSDEPKCDSVAVPVIDLLGANVVLVGTLFLDAGVHFLAALCDPGPQPCPPPSRWPVAGYVAAGVLAASSVYGFIARSHCNGLIKDARTNRALDEALKKSTPLPQPPREPDVSGVR
jgi:hypothetical protein